MEKLVVILSFLSGLIDKVPPSVWGVIIGALSALCSVALTNRAHDRRLKKQFEHEREVKRHDREMALRKEVYLGAAEAVSAGLIAVGHFSNLEIEHEKLLESYLGKASSISKTSIIAKEETIRAIAIFSGELVATFLRLTLKRAPLLQQSKEIVSLRTMVDTFLRGQTRILELMAQYNLEGLQDQRKWELLQGNFDFEKRRIDEASKKADKLSAVLFSQQLGFMEECMEESKRLSRLLVPVIVSVRKELDAPIDESAYARLTEEQIEKQTAVIREFSQQAHSLVTQKQGSSRD